MITARDITVGMKLVTYQRYGTYYPAIKEVVQTVTALEYLPEGSYFNVKVQFNGNVEQYPVWKQYRFEDTFNTADEYTGRVWLDGDPMAPYCR